MITLQRSNLYAKSDLIATCRVHPHETEYEEVTERQTPDVSGVPGQVLISFHHVISA